MSIQLLPTSLLYQIISDVPFPSRWEALQVCKSWHSICTDPYLYQDIHLEGMELKLLVRTLQWMERQGTVVRSLKLRHCYCDFLEKTLIPITTTHATMPLYSQLRTLKPNRRRLAYVQSGFHYYDLLSSTLAHLFSKSVHKLTLIDISSCDVDWAMTPLFSLLTTLGAGRHLTTWIYHDNYTNDDKRMITEHGCTSNTKSASTTMPSTATTANTTLFPSNINLLQAFVTACPEMKHFMGHHGEMNDTMLMTMAYAWPQLESIVLLPPDDPAAARQQPSTLSAKAFYSFLDQCPSLHTLELYDLECINQHQTVSTTTYPSIRHVTLTKFLTTPLSSQSIQAFLRLFPHLASLTYITNRTCFQLSSLQEEDWYDLIQCPFPPCVHLQWSFPTTMDQFVLRTSRQVMRMPPFVV